MKDIFAAPPLAGLLGRLVLVVLLVGGWGPRPALAQASTNLNRVSVAELENRVSSAGQMEGAFRVEGLIRAVVPQQHLLALEDASGTLLLELPGPTSTLAPGERVAIEGDHCRLIQTRFGVQVSALPVVENHGLHQKREVSGSVLLEAGLNPIRLEWFNCQGESALELAYEGPEFGCQPVPDSVLWVGPAGETRPNALQPGVRYTAYEGMAWYDLPDFSRLRPLGRGVATNFTTACRPRDENCGLVFEGLIQINRSGRYTFHLASDDGSRLYVGKPSVSCAVVASPGPSGAGTESFDGALADRSRHHWIEMEGEVVFAGENERSLELELVADGNQVPVTVVEGEGLFNLLHRRIRVAGVCEFSRDPKDKKLVGIFVPGSAQVTLCDAPEKSRDDSAKDLLTTAAEVRRLKPAEADKHIPSRIRGVVIYSAYGAAVLREASGGVFVGARQGKWTRQPGLGELWEMTGTTDPGDFSPVIVADTAKFLGYAPMPEPIRPTRDQLMNGNLDAEYGELRGVITAVSSTEITLLTPDGKISVIGNGDRPLPQLPTSAPGGGPLLGSVVRIRGCFATLVDLQTRQVTPGKVFIYPALVAVEDPSPRDPFQLPTRKASDLMWFDARSKALQRTKMLGQVLYAYAGQCFVVDGKTGFRALANTAPPLKPGDLIEVVGFPRLGGPSPVLLEAQIRKVGSGPLPNPIPLSPDSWFDRERDATRVQVEAILVSDAAHQGERVLELQKGSRHFVARWRSEPLSKTLIRPGCLLQLTGVYASADGEQERGNLNSGPFELLLSNTADVVVLRQAPWWTIRRAITAVVVLAGVLGGMFVWVAMLRRKVEERTEQLKREIEERQVAEQQHAIARERIRVAQDLHDELGAGLTEVSMLGALAVNADVSAENKRRYLDKLTNMARSLVTSLDEIVWAVNPHYDSVGSLVSYFSLVAESFLNLAGIACRLRVAKDIPEIPLDARQRHGVFCAFKEVLNNVVRHSKATEVQIGFEVADGHLVVSLVDNGCGFEFVAGAPGKDGLRGLAQRMEQLGGECQIASQPGRGTQVRIQLPLNQVQHGQSRNR